ncbi:MAG: FUSC family protein [Methylobacterium frigidaeris]
MASSPAVLDRTLDRLDQFVPPTGEWLYALRIWIAMMLALAIAFWLQLSSASSAMICVAILAQPKRGQAMSKAVYRLLGTLVGGVVAVALVAAFGQDRTLLLVSYAVWLAGCVFVAQSLRDTRAYGAVLSGYTVAIIAVAQIDAPQEVFGEAVERVAAIVLGILVITFINDALGAPTAWPGVRDGLARAAAGADAYCAEVLDGAAPAPERAAALIRQVTAVRADAHAVASERRGRHRAAAARSAIAALYAQIAACHALVEARERIAGPAPAVDEAAALCREAVGAGPGPERLEAIGTRLRALVEAAVGAGRPVAEVAALQRALDLANAATFVEDGARCLATGGRPLRDTLLPTHRDVQEALRAALRIALSFGLTAAFFIALGLPQTTFALVQASATCALSSVTPDPRRFALSVAIAMPVAVVLAGLARFGLLIHGQGFPVFAITLAPIVFLACFLSLRPATAGVGFILLVFTPVLISPANPQSYDAGTFFMNALLIVAAGFILFLTIRLVLPVSAGQHRAFALDTVRRDLADALAGEGGDATTRTSLNADRLVQFSRWTSGSSTARRASLRHAVALLRLEAAAARAHAQLRRLAEVPGPAEAVAPARSALAAGSAAGLARSAGALVAAGRGAAPSTRLTIARAAADLAAASWLIARHGRLLRRLRLVEA